MLLFTIAILSGLCHAHPVLHASLQRIEDNWYNDDLAVDDRSSQGVATDGGGIGNDVSNILWIIFGIITGLSLSGAGIRFGRISAGTGLGLLLAFISWITLVNTMSVNGIPDLAIVLIVFVFFSCGSLAGFFAIAFRSDVALGLVGGAAFAVRVLLLKGDLLVPLDYVNWILIGVFSGFGVILSIFWHRIGLIIGAASTGSFLSSLSIDLIMNKQDGISRGLRLLFDENRAHVADITTYGYHPRMTSLAWISVSLALIPFCFAFQYILWKDIPFCILDTERALSYYANTPSPYHQQEAEKEEKKRTQATYIKRHREKPREERASLGIDLTQGPERPVPVRLKFNRSFIAAPKETSDLCRFDIA